MEYLKEVSKEHCKACLEGSPNKKRETRIKTHPITIARNSPQLERENIISIPPHLHFDYLQMSLPHFERTRHCKLPSSIQTSNRENCRSTIK